MTMSQTPATTTATAAPADPHGQQHVDGSFPAQWSIVIILLVAIIVANQCVGLLLTGFRPARAARDDFDDGLDTGAYRRRYGPV